MSAYVTREFCPRVWALLTLVHATFSDDHGAIVPDESVPVPVEPLELEELDASIATWPLQHVLIVAGVVDAEHLFDALIETPVGQVISRILEPVGP